MKRSHRYTRRWAIQRKRRRLWSRRIPCEPRENEKTIFRQGSHALDSSSPPARSSPDECGRPTRGILSIEMLAAQGPVGTRGGVEWMRGPGACPGWGATCLLHAVPTGARCHQDKHQAPTLPHIRPLSLQDPIRSSTVIFAPHSPNGATTSSTRPPPCPTSAPCPYRTGTRAFPIRLSTIIRTGNAHDPIRLSTFIRIGADTLPVLVVNIHQGDRSNGQGFFFTLNLP